MRIQQKLFLILIGAGAFLVTMMLLLMQWSVDRGMLEYVNTREIERLTPVAVKLSELHAQLGDWDTVKKNPDKVQQLLKESRSGKKRFSIVGKPSDKRRNTRSLPSQHHLRIRLAILDADKQPVFGRYSSKRTYNLCPITQQGKVIGYLASPRRGNFTQGIELQFVQQQRKALIMIGGLVLAMALIIGWPLSQHFLKPIRQITQRVHELAQGDYQPLTLKRGDELGQLARDINELSNTLSKNDVLRKRWLADISHELRTPIAILRGEIEAILDGVRPLSEQPIHSLHQETQQLQKLVEDLHELSNADLGGLQYRKETTNLVELINDQIERHRPGFNNSNLTLSFNPQEQELNAWIDGSRINQLLDNLLNNSCKYTEAGGRVELYLSKEKDNAIIRVCDSAPGVPEHAIDKLFEYLYRVDSSRNRNTGGSGLGLAICQRIVEAHKGSITASRNDLGGLEIKVILPINQLQ